MEKKILEKQASLVDELEQGEKKTTKAKEPKSATANEELKKKIAEQESLIKSMQDRMDALLKIVANASREPSKTEEKEIDYVTVGCRAFSGAALANKDESICIVFRSGEEKEVLFDDLKEILRDSGVRKNKVYFEKGLFYFKNPEYYQQFAIKPKIDLSWEAIKKIILIPDIDVMIRTLQDLTKNKSDIAVVHTLQFTIAQMIADPQNPLMGMAYQNRRALEDFFGQRFDELINYVGIYSFLRGNG